MRLIKLFIGALAAVGSVLTLRWLFRSEENVDWVDAERPGQIAQVDGVGVHYVNRGSGSAVVLIHGFGGHTFSYRRNIPELAKHHRVVALDLKGFGYSERPPGGDYSLTAQAEVVIGLMDELGILAASIVGHSMGGEVAMRVASTHPERVDKLVLVASVSGDRFPTLPPLPIIKPIMPFLGRLTARFLLKRGFYDRTKLTEEVREGYRRPKYIRGFNDAIYRLMADMRHDSKIDYARINQPTLILWARAEALPAVILRKLRERLPHAEVQYIERAGHLLLEEQPEDCNRAILRFIAGRQTGRQAAEEPRPQAIDSVEVPS
jgi:pimeloyl-ACP methyl ester carboxylesterase